MTEQTAFKAIAQRIVNAENNFAETIQNIIECSAEDAHAIRQLYIKNKLAKLDPVIGRISVKHGALLDDSVLRNALSEVTKTT